MEQALDTIFRQFHNILFAYIFGSQAIGRTTKLSDLDVAIYLKKPLPKDVDIVRAKIGKKLEDYFRQQGKTFIYVDVTILNQASPLLAIEVVRTGKIIFNDHDEARVAFECQTLHVWEDQRHLLEVQEKILFEKIDQMKGMA